MYISVWNIKMIVALLSNGRWVQITMVSPKTQQQIVNFSAVHVIHSIFSDVKCCWHVTIWTMHKLSEEKLIFSPIFLCRCWWCPRASSSFGWLPDSMELCTFLLLWHWSSIRSNKFKYNVFWTMLLCFGTLQLCFLWFAPVNRHMSQIRIYSSVNLIL